MKPFEQLTALTIEGLNQPLEQFLTESGIQCVCGVDEAGRGPLAGPVVAAAVIYCQKESLWLARDSKALTSAEREKQFAVLTQEFEFAVGIATVEEIDRINILRASLLAMERAVNSLPRSPSLLLVDGLYRVPCEVPSHPIVHGDDRVAVISAASIIAKVTRDRLMQEMDKLYPEYGFVRHVGYATPEHRAALKTYGPCPIHRKSFHGVREFFEAPDPGATDSTPSD